MPCCNSPTSLDPLRAVLAHAMHISTCTKALAHAELARYINMSAALVRRVLGTPYLGFDGRVSPPAVPWTVQGRAPSRFITPSWADTFATMGASGALNGANHGANT
jgi:hypothetical protein